MYLLGRVSPISIKRGVKDLQIIDGIEKIWTEVRKSHDKSSVLSDHGMPDSKGETREKH